MQRAANAELTVVPAYSLVPLSCRTGPIGYLARHYETTLDADGRVVVPSHEQLPRGTVFKVP